jgi:ribose 5-phosphate isomerase B
VKIALTADHRGASLYNNLARLLKEQGHELVAVPTCEANSCDYPDMAYSACKAVAEGEADRAILLCGSGIGMSIAANKVKGIRAALVHDDIGAQTCRSHNDSNVVCLSADMLGQRLIEQIVQIFLATEFEGGRHTRRVEKINAIERGEDPSAITS